MWSLSSRGTGAFLAALLILSPAGPAAQSKEDKKQQEKTDQAQRQEIQALIKVVDGAAAGQPAPTEFQVAWRNDFLKALEGKTYVPFTLTIDDPKVAATPLAMYVRVAARTAPAAQATSGQTPAPAAPATAAKKPEFAFEDVHWLQPKGGQAGGGPYRISRAFAVPAGDYDVYIALRERPAASGAAPAPGRTTVLKQPVTVPNFWSSELTTSSVILAERVEPLKEPLAKDQQAERPYTLGNTEIVPALDTSFAKNEDLSIIFLIYNPGLGADKRPDLGVEYTFHQKVSDVEKYFNKTNPQNFNGQTLPAQFDLAAGHQLVAGQSVPLASFPEGDYRLEIKVADKISGKALTRNVTFTVVGS